MKKAVITANLLVEGQLVQLDLGGRTQEVNCRVLGFGGHSVMLAPEQELVEDTAEALAPGATAYVIVQAGGQIHALRSRIGDTAEPTEILVTVTDGFQLGQRRRYSRAPLPIGARLRSAEGAWETVTRDISAGGVRLARTEAAGEAVDAVEIVLEAAGLKIAARGQIVRRTAHDVSLRFTEIDPQDAALLQQLALAYYRRR